MLLKLSSATIVCGRDPKLHAFPLKSGRRAIGIDAWDAAFSQHDTRGLFVNLLFSVWGVDARLCLPGHRNELDWITLDRLCGGDSEFQSQYCRASPIFRCYIAQILRHHDVAGDLEQIPPIAGQLGLRWHALHAPRPLRLCQEEHAMKLSLYVDFAGLIGLVEELEHLRRGRER